MPQEFPHLEELFYAPVGADVGVSVSGFARVAAAYYEREGKRGPHVFRFDSVGVEDSLILTIGSYASPYVAQARIRQTTEDLDAILLQLRGGLEAHYAELVLPAPPDLSPARNIVDDGRLLVLQLPGRPDEDIGSRLLALGEAARRVIREADSLETQSAEFENNDPGGVLVHSKCRVRRGASLWAFDYFVGTANLDPLPESYVQRAEAIFQLASPKFRMTFAYRAKTSPFRQTEQNHGPP
jgi:hypothetical protein